jgi:hypothetical protein
MSWPSTETIVFAGIVALPSVSKVLGAIYVAIKGRPSDEEVRVAGNSPLLGHGITLFSILGVIAVVLYFWFVDPASQSLRDWLQARDHPGLP